MARQPRKKVELLPPNEHRLVLAKARLSRWEENPHQFMPYNSNMDRRRREQVERERAMRQAEEAARNQVTVRIEQMVEQQRRNHQQGIVGSGDGPAVDEVVVKPIEVIQVDSDTEEEVVDDNNNNVVENHAIVDNNQSGDSRRDDSDNGKWQDGALQLQPPQLGMPKVELPEDDCSMVAIPSHAQLVAARKREVEEAEKAVNAATQATSTSNQANSVSMVINKQSHLAIRNMIPPISTARGRYIGMPGSRIMPRMPVRPMVRWPVYSSMTNLATRNVDMDATDDEEVSPVKVAKLENQ